jgi:hypothetical protein
MCSYYHTNIPYHTTQFYGIPHFWYWVHHLRILKNQSDRANHSDVHIRIISFVKTSILWDIISCRTSTEISEEYIVLIFRVEECGKLGKKPTWSKYQSDWVSCLAYSSNLKLESICFSETSVDFQRTTRHYIPEDRLLHNYRCANLEAYAFPWSSDKKLIWYICTELN